MYETELYNEMVSYFEKANEKFIADDRDLILSRVSERSLCGALMQNMCQCLPQKYSSYRVDVEYNRNLDGKIKTIINDELSVINVTCDLIVHSRGESIGQDNLICLEMKKANRPTAEKEKDRDRVRILTKDSYDNIWSFDGTVLPEHVCRYVLGIYYEMNIKSRMILIEYYSKGEFVKRYFLNF